MARDHSGPLAPVGYLDRNQGALKNEMFTLVGYGLDIGPKKTQIVLQQRHSTTSYLKSVQSEVVAFQINDRDSRRAADRASATPEAPCSPDRTCSATPPTGTRSTCNATGAYQRVDTLYVRAFLNSFLTP